MIPTVLPSSSWPRLASRFQWPALIWESAVLILLNNPKSKASVCSPTAFSVAFGRGDKCDVSFGSFFYINAFEPGTHTGDELEMGLLYRGNLYRF